MLRSLLFIVFLWLWTLFIGVVYLPLLVLPRQAMGVAARFWLRGCFLALRWLCGLTYQVRGDIPQGAALIAAKHQSTFETFAFRLLLQDPAIILKRELLRIPVFGWYLAKTGVIAIDRSAGMKALKSMVKGAEQARDQSRQILIFPEGTRKAVGQEPDYHSGVAMLYAALDMPCIPVALNSGLFWGRGDPAKRAGTVIVEFLPPIPPGLDRKTFMAQLQDSIESASARLAQEARQNFPDLPH